MEPEAYPSEALADEEPRYLRRQKPVEIRRRKLGARAWRRSARSALIGLLVVAAGAGVYSAVRFALDSPQFLLADLEQIELRGNRFVPRAAVLERFAEDRGRSVLLVPLAERRAALERIPWVEQATVRRALPNRLEVELVERRPVAFLRLGAEMALVDAYGVILERPLEGEFRFPVVTGLSEAMPAEECEKRMKLFTEFLKDIELARPGSGEQVSEVNLTDAADLRATLAGLPELAGGEAASVLVYFGDKDFLSKFRVFVEHIAEWRAAAGRVDSVDLRFERQVVVNPEARVAGQAPPAGRTP